AWKRVLTPDAGSAGVAGPVRAAVDRRRLAADVFHDVYFAAGRPTCPINIVPEHPESRPHALARGKLDAGFKAPLSLLKKVLALEPRRGVVARHTVRARVGLLELLDHQVAILNGSVDGAVCVVFELTVAPALAADIVRPLCRVRERAVRGVKLVAPNECPRGGLRRSGGRRPAPAVQKWNAQEGKSERRWPQVFHSPILMVVVLF